MLVIFDCDGVLVDSERLAAEVFSSELHQHGVIKTPNECFSTFKGHTLSRCMELLASESFALPATFLSDLQESTRQAFSQYLKAIDGVTGVLRRLLDQKIDFCVASNGGYQKIEHSLKHTELWPFFVGKCFSAQSVERGKPAPDLFQWAALEMGYSNDDVFVVEDSITGVTAALAAGMQVLYFVDESLIVPTGMDVSLSSRVRHFHKMSQLHDLLGLG